MLSWIIQLSSSSGQILLPQRELQMKRRLSSAYTSSDSGATIPQEWHVLMRDHSILPATHT